MRRFGMVKVGNLWTRTQASPSANGQMRGLWGYLRTRAAAQALRGRHSGVVVLLWGLLVATPRAEAQDWLGWRGAHHEGRSPSANGPIHWSSDTNILWKTVIPGEGYSSPIVFRDSVYLTTALEVKENPILSLLCRYGLLGGVLSLTALAVHLVVLRCRDLSLNSAGLASLAEPIAFSLMAVVLCALVLFGEELLDFKRDPERGWMASTLVGTLCLGLCWFRASARSRQGPATGVSLLAFSAIIAATVPDRARAYEAGLFGPLATFTHGVIALPALAGILFVGLSLRQLGREWSSREEHLRPPLSYRVGLLLKGLAIIGSVLLLAALAFIVAAAQRRTHATVTVGELYQPMLRWWLVPISAGLVAPFVLWRLKAGSCFAANLGVALGAVPLCMLLLLSLSEQLMARTRYLSYLLGAARLTPMLGWKAALALPVVSSLSLVVSAIATRRYRPSGGVGLPVTFRVVASLLAALYLAYANFTPKGGQLVRAIVSVDRNSGTIRWINRGLSAPRGRMHSDNSPATPTPVTDGKRVFAYFGTAGLLCTDLHGRTVWKSHQLPFESREGVASSPILWEGRAIVLSESDAGHYIAALDCETGKLLWKTSRNKKVHSYAGNCRTPAVKELQGRKVIVVWGFEDISGYDTVTGHELWSHDLGDFGSGSNPVASMVSDDKRLYLVGPEKTVAVAIAKLGGRDSPVAWQREIYDGAQCCSPVVQDGLLFAVSDNGTAYCIDLASGQTLWRQQFGRQHYASPIATANRVYFCDSRGRTTVVSCDRSYSRIALNDLGELTHASFAPAGSQLFIRTKRHLYCVRER